MGQRPSSPSPGEAQELKTGFDSACAEVARILDVADVLLLCTGAGFSADSGLAIYADVAKIPVYASMGLEYSDICVPQWLTSKPELFWGFWGQCYNDYRDTGPHAGYEIIDQWAERKFRHTAIAEKIRSGFTEQMKAASDPEGMLPYAVKEAPGAFFVFTSNVDAHHFDWFRAEEIRECHGNTELYQCATNSDRKQSPCYAHVWRAPANFRFRVDKGSMQAPEGEPGSVAEQANQENLQVSRGTEPARVGNVRGGGRPHFLRYMQDLEGEMAEKLSQGFSSNHPKCLFCGGDARPAILMFQDMSWTDVEAQHDRWNAWSSSVTQEAKAAMSTSRSSSGSTMIDLSSQLRVAILEIGCGDNVTTVRSTAERFCRSITEQGAATRLIRVNPQFPFGDSLDSQQVVSVMGKGLETIRKIDAAWSALLSDRHAEKPDATEGAHGAGTPGTAPSLQSPAEKVDGTEDANEGIRATDPSLERLTKLDGTEDANEGIPATDPSLERPTKPHGTEDANESIAATAPSLERPTTKPGDTEGSNAGPGRAASQLVAEFEEDAKSSSSSSSEDSVEKPETPAIAQPKQQEVKATTAKAASGKAEAMQPKEEVKARIVETAGEKAEAMQPKEEVKARIVEGASGKAKAMQPKREKENSKVLAKTQCNAHGKQLASHSVANPCLDGVLSKMDSFGDGIRSWSDKERGKSEKARKLASLNREALAHGEAMASDCLRKEFPGQHSEGSALRELLRIGRAQRNELSEMLEVMRSCSDMEVSFASLKSSLPARGPSSTRMPSEDIVELLCKVLDAASAAIVKVRKDKVEMAAADRQKAKLNGTHHSKSETGRESKGKSRADDDKRRTSGSTRERARGRSKSGHVNDERGNDQSRGNHRSRDRDRDDDRRHERERTRDGGRDRDRSRDRDRDKEADREHSGRDYRHREPNGSRGGERERDHNRDRDRQRERSRSRRGKVSRSRERDRKR